MCHLCMGHVHSFNNVDICTFSVYVRKLLCEVVRLKVESEEVVNRIRVPNGEDLIMVRTS